MKKMLIYMILIFACGTGYAVTNYFVWKDNPSPQSPFTNWAMAATNIQDAVDLTLDGDTVIVTNGVYDTGGKLDTLGIGNTITNRVNISKAITLRSANNDPTNTIIKGRFDTGEPGAPGTVTNGPAAIRCVFAGSGPTLIGFTLTNGATQAYSAGGDHSYYGGGARVGNMIISNCIITGNSAGNKGGGAYGGSLYNCRLIGNSVQSPSSAASLAGGGGAASSVMSNCTLIGNSSGTDGGGVYISTLRFCTLTGNSAGNNGGGHYNSTLYNCTLTSNSASAAGAGGRDGKLYNCTVTGNLGIGQYKGSLFNCTITSNTGGGVRSAIIVSNCIIIGNSTVGNGGGVYGSPMYNCLVVGNSAGDHGGGMSELSHLPVVNCTIIGNSAGSRGGGVSWCYAMTNCIVYFNTTTSSVNPTSSNCYSGVGQYTCTAPLIAGSGNTDVNPMLVNTNAGNYRLGPNSPCVNTGTNQLGWMANSLDLDERMRIRYGTVDMGAFERIYSGAIFSIH